MPEQDEHHGKVAFITGGGRGFGKAFGAALSARGTHVVLADIDGARRGPPPPNSPLPAAA